MPASPKNVHDILVLDCPQDTHPMVLEGQGRGMGDSFLSELFFCILFMILKASSATDQLPSLLRNT